MTATSSRWLGALGIVTVAALSLTGCGSSSKASPQPSGSSSLTEVEHPCSDATLSIAKGRQLDFTACGADATATLTDPASVLSRVGTLIFVARAAGQATIDISRGPACSPGAVCSQARVQLARIVVNVS